MAKFKEIKEGYQNLAFRNEEIEKLAKERRSICNSCEYNSENKGGLFNESIPHCTLCGCILSAKVRSRDSECPKGKW